MHSGRRVNLTIRPAAGGPGHRVPPYRLGREIEARFDNVADTNMCTVLADPDMQSARVGTVEHLMAALSALAIDNVIIELDGPEVPILDGSAAPFVFLLDCAGSMELDAPRRVIEIRQTVRVTAGAAWAELRPLGAAAYAAGPVLQMDLSIEFAASAIGRQSCLPPPDARQVPPRNRRGPHLCPCR